MNFRRISGSALALAVALVLAAVPGSVYGQRSGGRGSGSVTAPEWSNELGAATLGTATNTTKLWTMWFPNSLSVSKITYQVLAADNTANLYDIGFYNASGTLVCHSGATAGTTFAPASNATPTLTMSPTCVFQAGARYTFAYTSNSATATLYGTNRRFLPQNNSNPTVGNTTTGGVLNSSITYSVDVWANGSGTPWLSLHN